MSLISIVEASKDFGVRNLFNNLTLHINHKERLGLIGSNGAGKSTLLKIIYGSESLNEGKRVCSQRLRIEIVNQDNPINTNGTVIEEVLAGCGEKRELLLKFNKLSEALAYEPNNSNLLQKLGEISERMDHFQAWQVEQECKNILQNLGIKDLHSPVKNLSGGYRKRVALASALVANPDILLLDEPTNHLDAETVEWLQSWLDNFSGAIILVTHDRYVLDRITKRILEIDKGEANHFNGNYSTYLKQKTLKEESIESSANKLKGILRKEIEWLRKGPKARSTKQKARIQRINSMLSKQIKVEDQSLEIESISRRMGKIVIEAVAINYSPIINDCSNPIINSFTYSFNKEDRVGIIGPNGCGKTTLLDLIAGKKLPNRGHINIGDTIKIGYLDQHTDVLKSNSRVKTKVIDFIEESATYINLKKKQISASQLLERFLFAPAKQHMSIDKLSGGEKRRLTLCHILIQAPNVLLLDEPTNDLDIKTLSVIEDFLDDFLGCVIIISHDRYFLDRTVDRIFSFEKGKVKQYEGNYSDFISKKKENEEEQCKLSLERKHDKNPEKETKNKSDKGTSCKEVSRKASNKKKLSFNEDRELKELDKKIPILEAEKNKIESQLTQGDKNSLLLSKELAVLVETLSQAEDRWIELSEKSE